MPFQPVQNFDGLAPTTTKGDTIARDTNTNVRIPVGADGTVLTASSGSTGGVAWAAALSNPMTTLGDIIYSKNGSGAPERLAANAGSTNFFLRSVGSTIPAWQQVAFGDLSGSIGASQFYLGATASSKGFVQLPGGYIFQWLSVTANSTGATSLWATPFTTLYGAVASCSNQSTAVALTQNATLIIATVSAGTPSTQVFGFGLK